MQHILPRDDTSHKSLSLPERTFLRSAARGTSSSLHSILRIDGRSPSESRPIRLSFSRCHNRAECTVQFGSGTRSAASVRAELVPPPNADRPNDGQVKFGVEVGPMGCMGYEVVPPVSNAGMGDAVDGGQVGSGGGGEGMPHGQRLKSNRILRLLERTLLIGGSIDAEALCVQSGNWVWRLHVDVSLLDDGGNAMDACVLAAVAALRHYRLPEVRVGGGDSAVDAVDMEDGGDSFSYQETTIIHSDDREPTPLPLHHTPLTATFALFSDELGTTTSVSALLDPFDREELASNGLLTWSYNKYGEMCCLDFPGGCELRPRQLMASAKLGKRRCIEICELLETALTEAEEKAQKERMDRLKKMNALRASSLTGGAAGSGLPSDVPFADVSNEDNGDATAEKSQNDAAARNEDEKYRLLALDYASGHFAASVKEDKDRNASQGKNMRGETSSLFHAILRSAQSTSMVESGNKGEVVKQGNNASSDNGEGNSVQKEEEVVEIIAHQGKAATRSIKDESTAKTKEKKSAPSTKPPASDSDEEEPVVQLKSEFSGVAINNGNPSTSLTPPLPQPMDSEPVVEKTEALVDTQPTVEGSNDDAIEIQTKPNNTVTSKKSDPMDVDTNEDDIDDLAMAMKKKKKKKSKKGK